VMGRASGPSTRRPDAAAPMRRLRSAGAVSDQSTVSRRAKGYGRPGGSRMDHSDGRARRRIARYHPRPKAGGCMPKLDASRYRRIRET